MDTVPEDVYGIRSVQKVTWLATYPNEQLGISKEDIALRFAKDDTDEGKQWMEERKKTFSDPNVHTWVAKEDQTVVGFCVASKQEEFNQIEAIYLLPEYQGKGVGKQLMERALIWLGGKKDIVVHVAFYNEQAINFYKNAGFVATDKGIQDDVAILPSGATIPEIEMRKSHE